MRDRIDHGEPAFVRPEISGTTAAPLLLRAPLRVLLFAVSVRYVLAAALALTGALAWTGVLAEALQPLVATSPALSWLGASFSVAGVARIVGGVELAAALLLVLSPLSAALALAGSLVAVASFAVGLSFLATAPGCFVTVSSFPIPVPTVLGAFLLMDVFPFLAASWSLLDAARSFRR